jgi:hypothetical protein
VHSDEEVEHITRSKLIYTAQVEKEDSNEKKSKSNAILLTASYSVTDADVRLATRLIEYMVPSKLISTAQVETEDSNEKKIKSNAILLTAGDSDTDADVRLATQLIEHLESKLLITAPNTLTIIKYKKSKVEKATPDTAVAASNDEDMDKAPGQVHQTTSKMSATSSDTNYKQAKIPANEQRQTTTMLKHWPQSVTSVTTKSLDCLNLQTQFPASAWNVTGLCRIHSISVLSAIQRITAAKSVKRLTGKENYVDASKVWKKAISMM